MKKKHYSGAIKVSKEALQTYYNNAESIRDPSKVRLQAMNLELLEATYKGDVEKLNEAIHGGADVSTRDGQGYSAAYITADRGHACLLKILIQPGITLDPLLFRAVEREDIEMVKTILDAGVEIDIEKTPSTDTRTMVNPAMTEWVLSLVSMGGHTAIAQLLLDHGAKTDNPNHTVDMFIRGHVDVVRILIAREQDINRRYGHSGATLLHLVAVKHAQLVAELIQRGFEINARDNNKRTPLSYALASQEIPYWYLNGEPNEEAARLLLDAGAEILVEHLAFMPPNLREKYIDPEAGNDLLH
jgi:ankyrin repeat protein